MSTDPRFVERTEQLDRDGFFVWPGLLPDSLVDRHLADYEALNAALAAEPREQAEIKQARYDFHRDNPATQELYFNPDLLAFLSFYFGEEPVMRQPETGLHHRKTPDHTDSLDFKVSPHRHELRMWCALEDIHPDSGPVYFVPGSHRSIAGRLERDVLTEHPELGELLRAQMHPTTAQEFYVATQPLWNYVKQRKIPTAIQENGVERVPLLLEKGDVVIFSSDCVHGTCRCANPALTRKYCVAYWSAAGAEWFQSRSYWGPLHDYRDAENAISAPVERTPLGLRMSFQELHAAYMASFEKAVVQPAVARSA
ncbi:MAG TPA: phytanoyl-CoA dioxygenase family protein [Thermoanaerobaculia bacterium]|nr:phytanoyl-CoA dioxygenase family protein [Thermoanaerobaculia bacterium]